ncbi:hypothetical protein PVAP13_5NG435200 [Panicum virgatum]|uniref:Uncharacterized protein n=2 Tax=Panicum virgatum TaxID=38727 RepID=A0A8T0S3U9_PANVG|nr:hypothetical protein PVAP13_5NG435200 [Panicum virgatum]
MADLGCAATSSPAHPSAIPGRGISGKRHLPERRIAADGAPLAAAPLPNSATKYGRCSSGAGGVRHHQLAALASWWRSLSAAAAVGAAGVASASPPQPTASSPPPQTPTSTPPSPSSSEQSPQPAAGSGGSPPQTTAPPPSPSPPPLASQAPESTPAPSPEILQLGVQSHKPAGSSDHLHNLSSHGRGEEIKKWKDTHLTVYTVFMLLALGGVGIGMMASTTAVGINWMRRVSANLARATSTVSVALLTIAVSKPIGYKWGIGFSCATGASMMLIWVLGDPEVRHWFGGAKKWGKATWEKTKLRLKQAWIATAQRLKQGWESTKGRLKQRWDSTKETLKQVWVGTVQPPPRMPRPSRASSV